MRYYSIIIRNQANNQIVHALSSPSSDATYTSFVNGQTLPGALNVELDLPISVYALPAGTALVRIWGVSLQEISQASDLSGLTIEVYGGMQRGLPLAKPQQSGLLIQGTIFQAFGNWQGLNQTLDLILYPQTGSPDTPINIVFNWKAGASFAQAIKSSLATALPGLSVNVSVSAALVLPNDETGFYRSLPEFAIYIKGLSQTIVGGAYSGVDIVIRQSAVYVYDGTSPTTPLAISFEDLVGQPTWIGLNEMQFNCIMRADIGMGDYVKLPPSPVITTQSAFANLRQKSSFQGVFQIIYLRHVGNFRQPDGNSWITTYNALQAI